jgi:NADH-quinone oxidoreductase subunit J
VILSAEFLAFALVIVYAGAILITYLFVIMLATEAPTAEEPEALSEYDRYSREPLAATVTAFVLLATLTTILGTGVAGLSGAHGPPSVARGSGIGAVEVPPGTAPSDRYLLAALPKRVETALRAARDAGTREPLMREGDQIARDMAGRPMIDTRARTVVLIRPTGAAGEGPMRTVSLPSDLDVTNTEGVAFTLLNEHPGSIEIAGVVLLMAMLGAVVLARKKVEMDELAKLDAQDRHLEPAGAGGLGA